ncbi:hypothetical protein HPP92_015760 [Vanilla planifolia]|uniref:PPC domain-containing protein n=1 Tax=Vanilla planifolia TaxID=51239 RepID=A0A835QEW9_VANPL|nr:hypothetical protein HPP92_015760 [Vanilla planifolia]
MNFNSFDIMKGEPFSDEVDSGKGTEKRSGKNVGERREKKTALAPQGGDGSSIEMAKRPRGRPPGSKNKPRPPMIITEAESSGAMRPHVVEILAGHDVADCLAGLSRRRNLGICVLAGSGAVANVALRQPAAPQAVSGGSGAAAAVVFHGRYEILSMSATFLPPGMTAESQSVAAGGMSISLAGPQGQVVGGIVAGPLIAAGTVVVLAAGFGNPTFHRLPVEEDLTVSVSASGGDDKGVMQGPPPVSVAPSEASHQKQRYHGEEHQQFYHHFRQQPPRSTAQPSSSVADTHTLAIYGSHYPPDIVWPTSARPPPPPPF